MSSPRHSAAAAPVVSEHRLSGICAEDTVEASLHAVQKWVEDHHYRGYEPFDGLSSWARTFAFRNIFAERLLQQAVRQSPLNLRPILGIPPLDSTKGRGYMAWGYLTLYGSTKQSQYLDKAVACLEWLDAHKVPGFLHHSWSNHYDFSSRGGSYTHRDPIIVWTALIGQAYLDAFELTRNDWFLRIAESVGNWILALPREKTRQGDCLSYFANRQSSVHNSNMLGAAYLARLGVLTDHDECLRVARSAMEYSCSRQLPNGSWWYGEDSKWHWIDNFHTGYNLESLDCYIRATGDSHYHSHLDRGLAFYKSHFVEDNGRPKYYHVRTYPVDIQCAAQSIQTLAGLSTRDASCLGLAQRVAAWTIRNMQDSKGYFYYRQYPLITAKTPMLHWGQATMFKALAQLLVSLRRSRTR